MVHKDNTATRPYKRLPFVYCSSIHYLRNFPLKLLQKPFIKWLWKGLSVEPFDGYICMAQNEGALLMLGTDGGGGNWEINDS